MFQLLGVELVRMAKTRFRREEEKIEERRPSPPWSFPLPFLGYGNLYSGIFSALFIV